MTVATTSARPRASVLPDYAFVLPPGWVDLPLGAGRRAGLNRLLRTHAGTATTREAAMALARTRAALERVTDRAERCGALSVHLALTAGGAPVPAALTVAAVEATEADLGRITAALHEPGSEVRLVDLPAGRCTRVVSRSAMPAHPALHDRCVAFHLPTPDRGAVLSLTFTTPLAVLAESYTMLFDAVAATLRWGG